MFRYVIVTAQGIAIAPKAGEAKQKESEKPNDNHKQDDIRHGNLGGPAVGINNGDFEQRAARNLRKGKASSDRVSVGQ
jgi:hypothetical protein